MEHCSLLLTGEDTLETTKDQKYRSIQPASQKLNTYSGLDDVIGTGFAPGDVCGFTLAVNGDRVASNNKLAILDLNGALEAAVSRIVLEHVRLRIQFLSVSMEPQRSYLGGVKMRTM